MCKFFNKLILEDYNFNKKNNLFYLILPKYLKLRGKNQFLEKVKTV